MGILTWLFLVSLAGFSYSNHFRGCFFTDWSQYRVPFEHFPENIDANLCTHIYFAYAKLVDNELKPLEEDDETNPRHRGLYDRVNDLKKENPQLKTILSVGGSKAGTEEMSKMLSTKENRAHFVEIAIKYLRDRSFDGLDLHFEYPGRDSSPPEDKQRFTLLAKELHEAFKSEQSPSDSKLILTASVSGVKENVDKAYEIEQLNEFFDLFNLMTYDYHGSWEPTTGHNAPLYAKEDNLSLDWSAKYWVSKGVNPSKILLGMPGYGRCFNLKSPEKDGFGAPVTGPCQAGEFTKEAGLLSYFEICKLLKESTAKVKWSESHQAPYLVNKNVWVGFDNEKSLKLKTDYIRDQGYGGWFFWDTSLDDFKGTECGQGAYPLLKTLVGVIEQIEWKSTTHLPTTEECTSIELPVPTTKTPPIEIKKTTTEPIDECKTSLETSTKTEPTSYSTHPPYPITETEKSSTPSTSSVTSQVELSSTSELTPSTECETSASTEMTTESETPTHFAHPTYPSTKKSSTLSSTSTTLADYYESTTELDPTTKCETSPDTITSTQVITERETTTDLTNTPTTEVKISTISVTSPGYAESTSKLTPTTECETSTHSPSPTSPTTDIMKTSTFPPTHVTPPVEISSTSKLTPSTECETSPETSVTTERTHERETTTHFTDPTYPSTKKSTTLPTSPSSTEEYVSTTEPITSSTTVTEITGTGPYSSPPTFSDRSTTTVIKPTSESTLESTLKLTSPPEKIGCYGLSDGDYKHSKDCHSFMSCSNKIPHVIQCPVNLYFDDVHKKCAYFDELPVERQSECGGVSTVDHFTTTSGSTTEERICSKSKMPDPTDCHSYVTCLNGIETLLRCSDDFYYDDLTERCVHNEELRWERLIECVPGSTIVLYTTSPSPPTTTSSPCDGSTNGNCKHETDCHSFLKVVNGRVEVMRCPGNLYFNELTKSCTSQFELPAKRKMECKIY